MKTRRLIVAVDIDSYATSARDRCESLRKTLYELLYKALAAAGATQEPFDLPAPAVRPSLSASSPSSAILVASVTGMAARRDRTDCWYWQLGFDGGIFVFRADDSCVLVDGQHRAAAVAGVAAGRDWNDYWLVGSDGGIFAFGAAAFERSHGWGIVGAPAIIAACGGNAIEVEAVGGTIIQKGISGFGRHMPVLVICGEFKRGKTPLLSAYWQTICDAIYRIYASSAPPAAEGDGYLAIVHADAPVIAISAFGLLANEEVSAEIAGTRVFGVPDRARWAGAIQRARRHEVTSMRGIAHARHRRLGRAEQRSQGLRGICFRQDRRTSRRRRTGARHGQPDLALCARFGARDATNGRFENGCPQQGNPDLCLPRARHVPGRLGARPGVCRLTTRAGEVLLDPHPHPARRTYTAHGRAAVPAGR